MPEISRFMGITIAMWYNDRHQPHFHVRYAGKVVPFGILSLNVLEGELPPRILGTVVEWAAIHQEELMENWNRLRNHLRVRKIKPLE